MTFQAGRLTSINRTCVSRRAPEWRATYRKHGDARSGRGNLGAGGDNAASLARASFLPGSTVKVEGGVIVANGTLKI
jgi:hypothetical protein